MVLESDDEELRIASGRSHFTVRTHPAGDFPRLPVSDRRHGHAAGGRADRGAGTGDPGGVQRGLPADPDRRADGRRGRRPAPGRHRLVPPGRSGPPWRWACWPKVSGCWCRPGRSTSSCACSAVPSAEVSLRLGPHDATFTVGPVTLTTRLIEGEFPNYRQLIPFGVPQPADRGPRSPPRRRSPGQAAGPGRHHAGADRHAAQRASS